LSPEILADPTAANWSISVGSTWLDWLCKSLFDTGVYSVSASRIVAKSASAKNLFRAAVSVSGSKSHLPPVASSYPA